MRVSFLRDAGHFFEKKSKKNSPVFLRATNKGDFLRATFFLQKKSGLEKWTWRRQTRAIFFFEFFAKYEKKTNKSKKIKKKSKKNQKKMKKKGKN